MKRLMIACLAIGSLIVIGCAQPVKPSGSNIGDVIKPDLPISSGTNPFSGKTFIIDDEDNVVCEKIVFADTEYTGWAFQNDQWECCLRGEYSYDATLSRLYTCDTLICKGDALEFDSIATYLGKLIDDLDGSDTQRMQVIALRLGLDKNADKTEIKQAFLAWFSKTNARQYTIGDLVTVNGATGIALRLAGVYDGTLEWYEQRNGGFVGESSSESECNIKQASIQWCGAATLYGNYPDYFQTDITDTAVNFIANDGTKMTCQYTHNGNGAFDEITLYGSTGFIKLRWKPRAGFLDQFYVLTT